MPIISRQVGTVSSLLNVFIPNATVTTGAGLANIIASTVTLAWYRNNQAAVSSWTLTTGTLGTWAGSTMVQALSTNALGWYQISLPNGLFASGDMASVHLSGAASMAPVPILIELTKSDNQVYVSSQVFSSTQTISTVSGSVGVSSIGTAVSVTSAPATVGVSSFAIEVGVSSIAAGVVSSHVFSSTQTISTVSGPIGVSTIATPVTASSVTRTVGVSTVTIPVGVSSLTAAALGNFFDTGAVFFSTAVVSSVVFEIATNATIGGAVGVSSIAIPVSVSGATIPFGVSSISTPVSASSVTALVGVSTATAAVYEGAADALLLRNVSSGVNTGRTVREALYAIRNRVDLTNGIVYQTDDTTSSWAFTTSTSAVDPVVEIDPA